MDNIKENKQIYIINEDLTENEVNYIGWLDSDLKLIYDNIKAGVNTVNKLASKYNNMNVRECLNNLCNCNLIKKTDNISID